jgi:hypothetical protein
VASAEEAQQYGHQQNRFSITDSSRIDLAVRAFGRIGLVVVVFSR